MRDRFLGILGLGKDQGKPKEAGSNRFIEIGGSNYSLSAEAQKFLDVESFSTYKKQSQFL